MVVFIICFAFVIIFTFFWGLALGRDLFYRSFSKKTTDDMDYSVRHYDGKGSWTAFMYLAIWLGLVLFCALNNCVKQEVIDDYRNNKIIEKVTYTYKKVNGEKVLTDSTYYYTKNKEVE